MLNDKEKDLYSEYMRRKKEYDAKWLSNKQRIRHQNTAFNVFVKCILSSKTNWNSVKKTVDRIDNNGILFNGRKDEILKSIKAIGGRVDYNQRAEWIVSDRGAFPFVFWIVQSTANGQIPLCDTGLTGKELVIKYRLAELMNLLTGRGITHNGLRIVVKQLKGAGDKQASHFLHSLGFEDYAIIDSRVMKKLIEFNIITKPPKPFTTNRYLALEKLMREFSNRIGIPLYFLDMLWWSR